MNLLTTREASQALQVTPATLRDHPPKGQT